MALILSISFHSFGDRFTILYYEQNNFSYFFVGTFSDFVWIKIMGDFADFRRVILKFSGNSFCRLWESQDCGSFSKLWASQDYGSFLQTLEKSRLWVILADFGQVKIFDKILVYFGSQDYL